MGHSYNAHRWKSCVAFLSNVRYNKHAFDDNDDNNNNNNNNNNSNNNNRLLHFSRI